MRVYLVQHGEAHPEEVSPERELTPRGRSDVERVAALLANGRAQLPTWARPTDLALSGVPYATTVATIQETA